MDAGCAARGQNAAKLIIYKYLQRSDSLVALEIRRFFSHYCIFRALSPYLKPLSPCDGPDSIRLRAVVPEVLGRAFEGRQPRRRIGKDKEPRRREAAKTEAKEYSGDNIEAQPSFRASRPSSRHTFCSPRFGFCLRVFAPSRLFVFNCRPSEARPRWAIRG